MKSHALIPMLFTLSATTTTTTSFVTPSSLVHVQPSTISRASGNQQCTSLRKEHTSLRLASLSLIDQITSSDVFATTNALFDPSTPLLAVYPQSASMLLMADATSTTLEQQQQPLSNMAIVGIFVVGLVPFAVATIEFWRRIAVGASFGTGKDSVVFPTATTIGEDDAPLSSRGRRVLGQDALVTAYILFAVAAAVLTLVLVSVVTTPPPPSSLQLPSSVVESVP